MLTGRVATRIEDLATMIQLLHKTSMAALPGAATMLVSLNTALKEAHDVANALNTFPTAWSQLNQPGFTKYLTSDGTFVRGYRTEDPIWAYGRPKYAPGVYHEENYETNFVQCAEGLHFYLTAKAARYIRTRILPVLVPVEDVIYVQPSDGWSTSGKCRARSLIVVGAVGDTHKKLGIK